MGQRNAMPARGRRWSRRHFAFTLLIFSAAPAAAQERMSFRADMELPPLLGATWLIVGSVASNGAQLLYSDESLNGVVLKFPGLPVCSTVDLSREGKKDASESSRAIRCVTFARKDKAIILDIVDFRRDEITQDGERAHILGADTHFRHVVSLMRAGASCQMGVSVSDVRRVTASSNDFKGHDVLADRLKLVETSCTVD